MGGGGRCPCLPSRFIPPPPPRRAKTADSVAVVHHHRAVSTAVPSVLQSMMLPAVRYGSQRGRGGGSTRASPLVLGSGMRRAVAKCSCCLDQELFASRRCLPLLQPLYRTTLFRGNLRDIATGGFMCKYEGSYSKYHFGVGYIGESRLCCIRLPFRVLLTVAFHPCPRIVGRQQRGETVEWDRKAGGGRARARASVFFGGAGCSKRYVLGVRGG